MAYPGHLVHERGHVVRDTHPFYILTDNMRIGVNLTFLVPGEVGGSEPLLTNLVESMALTEHELIVFAVRGFSRAYPSIAERTKVISVPWSSGAQGRRILAENTWLAGQTRKLGLDVIHHGVGTSPIIRNKPTVVTIHDIQYVHHPQNFAPIKRAWLQMNVPFTARRSQIITVPSEFVKADLVRHFAVSGSKVRVVPFGSERLLGPNPASGDDVRSRYNLERDFFIFPGRTYPHKNHRFLIEAFAPLASGCDLVFTGAPWGRDSDIDDTVRHLGLVGKVRRLGLVPRADLGGLYKASVALVYPTRFEGFGAPVLEAMSMGTPVITSDATSVPEVAGDAAILISPDDTGAWTEAMSKVLADQTLRDDLIRRGLLRSAMFSWKDAASKQLSAYQEAVASWRR